MNGERSGWLHFDQSLEVAAASWADLGLVVAAYDSIGRHGQVVVQLSGPLSGNANDAAVYLGELLGQDATVLESGANELLVARRPRRLRPSGGAAGDREPRRPRPGDPTGQIARELPKADEN